MKLQLLDVNEFVQKNKLKPTTTIKLYEKPGKTDPNGLFSEEIYGRFGSAERRRNFSYVNLRCTIIHPEAFYIIIGLDSIISKLLSGKIRYSVSPTGTLVEDSAGGSGYSYFISIFDKLDLNKFKKNKESNVNFLKANRDKIFVDKWIILPAGIRDLSISKTSGKTLVNFSDLSEMYSTLVRHVNMIGESMPEEIKDPVIDQIQKTVQDINNWIKKRMTGKQGLIRGGLLRKVTDYSGRMVVTTDHTLELGTVGIPWQNILKLYEPFAINYVLKKDTSALGVIQQFLKSEQSPDANDLKRLFANLVNKPTLITEQLKTYFIHVAKEIVEDKMIIYKRDPVNNRDSWLAANIRVDEDGLSMKLNPLDLKRTGGDHD